MGSINYFHGLPVAGKFCRVLLGLNGPSLDTTPSLNNIVWNEQRLSVWLHEDSAPQPVEGVCMPLTLWSRGKAVACRNLGLLDPLSIYILLSSVFLHFFSPNFPPCNPTSVLLPRFMTCWSCKGTILSQFCHICCCPEKEEDTSQGMNTFISSVVVRNRLMTTKV